MLFVLVHINAIPTFTGLHRHSARESGNVGSRLVRVAYCRRSWRIARLGKWEKDPREPCAICVYTLHDKQQERWGHIRHTSERMRDAFYLSAIRRYWPGCEGRPTATHSDSKQYASASPGINVAFELYWFVRWLQPKSVCWTFAICYEYHHNQSSRVSSRMCRQGVYMRVWVAYDHRRWNTDERLPAIVARSPLHL